MGLATGRDLHVDGYLTNVAINYRAQNFIGDLIAPVVSVAKETDIYPVFSRFEAFATENTKRSRGQEVRKITRSVGSAAYQCVNYALGADIALEDQANMDNVFTRVLEAGKAQYVTGKLQLDYSKRVLTLAANSANVSSVFVVNSSWQISGANAGDPVAGVLQVMEYMMSTTGQRPNSMLIGWRAWNRMLRNYQFRNFIKGVNNGGGSVTRQNVADSFELERLVVSEEMWHTANEAAVNSGVLTNAIADDCLLYYAPMAPSIDLPSWMYAFRWSNPMLPTPFAITRLPFEQKTLSEVVQGMYWQDEKVTGVDYACRIVTNAASGAAGVG